MNKSGRGSNIKYNPFAFTEQGIYMLMTVLKGEQAVAQSKALSGEVHNIHEHLGKVDLSLQKVMENFIDPSTYKHFLILDGQKLESDIAYTQIYCKAQKSITIIDRYLGVKTLDLLRDVAKRVLIKIISDARCEGL